MSSRFDRLGVRSDEMRCAPKLEHRQVFSLTELSFLTVNLTSTAEADGEHAASLQQKRGKRPKSGGQQCDVVGWKWLLLGRSPDVNVEYAQMCADNDFDRSRVGIGGPYFVYEPCFAKASSSDRFAVGSFTLLFSNVPKSACTANPLANPKT